MHIILFRSLTARSGIRYVVYQISEDCLADFDIGPLLRFAGRET